MLVRLSLAGRREASSAPPVAVSVEKEGISFQLAVEPIGGYDAGALATRSDARVSLTLRDARTGEPLRGLRPLAWMSKDRGGAQEPPGEAACRERIRGYLGGLLATRPDVDLNGYLVVTLDDGNSLSVINPLVAFGRTRLERLITLSGRPEDWALAPDGKTLYVTLPHVDRLAVVDTAALRVEGSVDTGSRPTRVAVAPDGATVWVGNDGAGTVSVIDAASRSERATLAAHEGHVELAFHRESGTAWIASSGSPLVEIYALEELQRVGTVDVGFAPAAIATSPLSRAVYVAGGAGVVEIDPERRRIANRVALEGAVSALAVDPGGRWIFAASREAGTLAAIDASNATVRHAWSGLGEPDDLAFSDDYLYVRDRAAARIHLVERARLATATGPGLVEIPVGQRAPMAGGRSQAASIVDTPEPGTVLVANSADRALYVYREGMMAPVGSQLTYGREPRAILVLDRALREEAPGRHVAHASLRGNGRYTVALLLESPRIATCFPVEVEGIPEVERPDEPMFAFTPLTDTGRSFAPGEPVELRFRLADAAGASPAPEELSLLVHRAPGNHQWRPVPVAEGGGVYRVRFEPPLEGRYRLLAAAPLRGVRLGDLPPVEFSVAAPPPAVGKAAP